MFVAQVGRLGHGNGGGYLRATTAEDAWAATQRREQDFSRPPAKYWREEDHWNVTDGLKEGFEELAQKDAVVAKDSSFWSSGTHRFMTVYHQTSPEICAKIMATNFRIGRGGLCGRAVYFALSPEATSTKAITGNSHGGCMIEAVVDVGKQDRYYWSGRPQPGEKYCGGWNEMTAEKLHATVADSIVMRQGDGDEIIVFEPERIIIKKVLEFDCKWMCKGRCQQHWPSHCHRR